MRLLRPIIARANQTTGRIEYITGGSAEFWSLENEDAGRSRKYHEVGIDEAGLVQNLGDIWHAAISPTLIDYQGGAFLAGTPKGRNFFAQCYQWGQDPLMTDWASWQMPTNANPHIPESEIDRQRQSMPERLAQQEIDAIFLEDSGGVFRNVATCSTGTPQPPISGHQYTIGCDFAKSQDFSSFSVWDVATRTEVYLDRSNKVDYEVQIQRLVALAQRYNNATLVPETNSIGVPIIEQLERRGVTVLPFTTTNATKSAAIEAMQLALEQQSVTLLNDPIATAEMQAYEMERLPSGMFRYSAPEGQHDDTIVSRLLGFYGVNNPATGFAYSYDPRTKRR